MPTVDPVDALMGHLGPVTAILDDAVAGAIDRAEQLAVRYDHARFSYIRPLIVRAEARLALENQPLPAGWEVGGKPGQMGQLILHKRGVMDMRFLKGNPLQSGLVPHAGSNAARRAVWRQDPITGLPADDQVPLSFLMVWDYLDITNRIEGFSLNVAHPLAPGKYGRRVPCDLVVPIPRGGTMFEELAAFRHDEVEDLFAVEISKDEVSE